MRRGVCWYVYRPAAPAGGSTCSDEKQNSATGANSYSTASVVLYKERHDYLYYGIIREVVLD